MDSENTYILTSNPGMGLPADPGLIGKVLWTSVLVKLLPAVASRASPEIGEPDSEDHQLSMTWAPGAQYFSRSLWYMRTMLGSLLSPARNSPLSCFKPPRWPAFSKNLFSGSSRLIALRAVGAVLSTLTLCSSIILQNVLASGVPMGFPSKRTEVAPASSGAYTMYECPTTHPISEAQNITFPRPWIPNKYLIERFKPTACPPASRRTPFGKPIVPLDYGFGVSTAY